MIQPNELRIGNYFKWSDIASMGIGVDRIRSGQMIQDYQGFKEPIPLSPEWLERFGFKNVTKNDDLNTHFQISNNGFTIHFEVANPSNLPYCFVEMIGLDITKVHQLQNLYFALTGTELTLNP